ncbi:MAG: hypothetical protein ACKO3P_08870, partial [Planctomycetaceae bacterium]
RRKTSPAQKPPARKTTTRKLVRESQPELINRVAISDCVSGPNYPLLKVVQEGDFSYAVDVEGVAIGAPVEWVKGILLDPNETIPNTPPEHHERFQVVDAAFGKINRDTLETAYTFPPKRLGPVESGRVVRLVTWVKFRSGQVVMASNLTSFLTMQCGNFRAEILNLVSGGKVAVVSRTVQVRVKCNVAFDQLIGKFYTVKPAIDCKPDMKDYSSKDFPGGVTEESFSVGSWTNGVTNWLAVWARGKGTANYKLCDNSPMALTE